MAREKFGQSGHTQRRLCGNKSRIGVMQLKLKKKLHGLLAAPRIRIGTGASSQRLGRECVCQVRTPYHPELLQKKKKKNSCHFKPPAHGTV